MNINIVIYNILYLGFNLRVVLIEENITKNSMFRKFEIESFKKRFLFIYIKYRKTNDKNKNNYGEELFFININKLVKIRNN